MSCSPRARRKSWTGADEKEAARLFIASSLLSRCSQSTMGKIRDALNSDTAAELNTFYRKCMTEDTSCFDKEAPNVQRGTATVGSTGHTYLNILGTALNRNIERLNPKLKAAMEKITEDMKAYCQEVWEKMMNNEKPDIAPPADLQKLPPNLKALRAEIRELNTSDIGKIGGQELVDDMVSLAKESNVREVNLYIDRLVDGKGQGADAFRSVMKKKLGDGNQPQDYLAIRLNLNAMAMMNWTICGEMKKIALGQECQFQKNVDSPGNITLLDGKKKVTLSKDFTAARNELAQFLTGNKEATYQSLEPKDKNKIHLMMAMLSPELDKVGETGVQYALDPKESQDAYRLDSSKTNPPTRTVSLEITNHGVFILNYDTERPLAGITTDDAGGIPVGEGSSFNSHIQYTFGEQEFQRLANLDYTKFNDDEATKLRDNRQEMPDGTKQFTPNKLIKAADTFSQEFKPDATCALEFNMKLNPTDEEVLREEIQWN